MKSMVEAVLQEAIEEKVFPGACYAYGDVNRFEVGWIGRHWYADDAPLVGEESLWDMASVSKVISTTTLAMKAFEEDLLDLDQFVAFYLPRFGNSGKEAIRVRNLLLHNSGLIAFRRYYLDGIYGDEILRKIDDDVLVHPIGEVTEYSDLNMIVLGGILEKLSGKSLSSLFNDVIHNGFSLPSTGYNPSHFQLNLCPPTEALEEWRKTFHPGTGKKLDDYSIEIDGARYIRGEVHDPNTAALGGVAGHAGLFSNVLDVARFAQIMLGKELRGTWRPNLETIRMFTTRASASSTRALGWDTRSLEGYTSAGAAFSAATYGHTGYTGTSLWIDPVNGCFHCLLAHRVFPTSENDKIFGARQKYADAVAKELLQ